MEVGILMDTEKQYQEYLRRLLEAYFEFAARHTTPDKKMKYKKLGKLEKIMGIPSSRQSDFIKWLDTQNNRLHLFGLKVDEGDLKPLTEPSDTAIWLMSFPNHWEFYI
jgi:hypothetical protein